MSVMSLFLCAGLFADANPATVQAQAAREGGRVIIHKPLCNLLPTSRVVFPGSTPPSNYTKRAVGQSGESLPVQTGTLAESPAIRVERITVTGGRVEITAESIVIDGGRVEITRQPSK